MRGKDSLEYGEENGYLSIKNHKDPKALEQTMGPSCIWLASLT